MKALSIQQPWPWAIFYAGKPVENRTWGTNYRGPLLIHASKTFDYEGYAYLAYLRNREHPNVPELPEPEDFPRGGIVGRVELVDVVDDYLSIWFFGPRGWVLRNPEPLPFVPLRGMPGLFEVPDTAATWEGV